MNYSIIFTEISFSPETSSLSLYVDVLYLEDGIYVDQHM